VLPSDSLTRSGAPGSMASTRVPVKHFTCRPLASHQSLDHAAGGGAHHARHHAVAHLHHGELHAARGQRLHDDAADEAGTHLQHARARLGQLRMMARASARVQQVCTPARGCPESAASPARAGGDQQRS
jgi:hypothetical protein